MQRAYPRTSTPSTDAAINRPGPGIQHPDMDAIGPWADQSPRKGSALGT